jgi:hypothetical protein
VEAGRGVTSNATAIGVAVGAALAAGVVYGVLFFALGAASIFAIGTQLDELLPASDLAALESDCGGGDLRACDELWAVSPFDSELEAFGASCGGTVEVPTPGSCAGGGATFEGTGDLTALRAACEAGELVACDELYLLSPIGSDDETFGSTCGGTAEATLGACADRAGLDEDRAACADGDLAACDDLYFLSPLGSDDEAFGSTCGDRREATFGQCAEG